jgi:ADP-ribose pyrophosphatase YjhB (NUDIX family)
LTVDKRLTVDRRRRVAAYGLCRDGEGRVLLVRASARSNTPGVWSLPGGGIEHGEHPADGVVREVAEETGLTVKVTRLRDVLADITEMPWRNVALHHDRIVYDVTVVGGSLRDEPDGTSDVAAWLTLDELAGQPLLPFVAELLGLPHTAATSDAAGSRPDTPDTAGESGLDGVVAADPDGRIQQVRRFSSYGLVTDPAGRVLLTLISAGYPGAGRWHLPGGGTDHGESPTGALLRELAEETDQVGEVTGLLEVSHRHNPAALGPEGYPIDWHVVRVLYQARVAVPTEPRVTEVAGGSTAEARWFSRAEALALPLTEIASRALEILADSPLSLPSGASPLPSAASPVEPESVVPAQVAPRPSERDDK